MSTRKSVRGPAKSTRRKLKARQTTNDIFGSPPIVKFRSLTRPRAASKFKLAGAESRAQTVVYVHGIGNHAAEPILVERWDRAAFSQAMGDRTRMAYWVNRTRYPQPEECDCSDPFKCGCHAPRGVAGMRSMTVPGTDPAATIDTIIGDLTEYPEQQEFLRGLARDMMNGGDAEACDVGGMTGIGAKGIGDNLLVGLTGIVGFIAMPDVFDFCFRPERRQKMIDILKARLETGGGPFVIVAHSQGSMIAYELMRQLNDEIEVDLFVTIGSPLGFPAVRSVFEKWTGKKKLPYPECVKQWINVSAKGDPVAFDGDLKNDIQGANGRFINFSISRRERKENPLFNGNPHASLGYLNAVQVKRPLHDALGPEFLSAMAPRVITSDLHSQIEATADSDRHAVLIQVAESDQGGRPGLDEGRAVIEKRLFEISKHEGFSSDDMQVTHHARFVSARLRRSEMEVLRTEYNDLQIRRLWRNASKRALVYRSAQIAKIAPAHHSYGALGNGIEWAVLDTGIHHLHPHFGMHRNIASLWDCTKPKTRGRGDAGIAEPEGGFVDWRGVSPEWPANVDLMIDRNGHGTHVAGIIAGEYPDPLDIDGGKEFFKGMAPKAKLHVYKVLDDGGSGEDAWIITALDKIASINEAAGALRIHGINLSLGGAFDPSAHGCGHTPLCNELRRLWRQGVIVVIAAGNEGHAVLRSVGAGAIDANMDLSIGDPANLEEAIAVGSVHRDNPHTFGISYFSSRGPTADGRRKPDLVAPGEKIYSARADFKKLVTAPAGRRSSYAPSRADQLYVAESGTSMAAPHVSGALAAFLSMRKEFIGYPDRVKRMLLEECTDLGRDAYAQGAGMINLVAMLSNI